MYNLKYKQVTHGKPRCIRKEIPRNAARQALVPIENVRILIRHQTEETQITPWKKFRLNLQLRKHKMTKVLYYAMRKSKESCEAKLKKVPVVGLDEIQKSPACKLLAQILHVKKAMKNAMVMYSKDRRQKTKGFYDRIVFLR
jgi:hypothetical protein